MAGLELATTLPRPLECWDCRRVALHLAEVTDFDWASTSNP